MDIENQTWNIDELEWMQKVVRKSIRQAHIQIDKQSAVLIRLQQMIRRLKKERNRR